MRVLITGGSEGLGLELARLYARSGADLILAARHKEKLERVGEELRTAFSVQVELFEIDLSCRGAAQKLFDRIQEQHLTVDVLINNAGMGSSGRTWTIPLEKDEDLITLNDIAPVSLSKLFLRDMTTRHAGTIINIASNAAFQPGPYCASYYAAKAFLVSYTRAVAREARPYGVRVCCYCPGPIRTAFYEKSGAPVTIGAVTPAQAAADLFRASAQKTVIIPGFWNKAAAYFVPSYWKMRILERMKRKNLKKDQ
jgi:short-subunit dehydrogenase